MVEKSLLFDWVIGMAFSLSRFRGFVAQKSQLAGKSIQMATGDRLLGWTCDGLTFHPGGVEILLGVLFHRNKVDWTSVVWASYWLIFAFVFFTFTGDETAFLSKWSSELREGLVISQNLLPRLYFRPEKLVRRLGSKLGPPPWPAFKTSYSTTWTKLDSLREYKQPTLKKSYRLQCITERTIKANQLASKTINKLTVSKLCISESYRLRVSPNSILLSSTPIPWVSEATKHSAYRKIVK